MYKLITFAFFLIMFNKNNGFLIFFLGLLPCNSDKVTVTPVAPDPKNAVTVCGEKPGTPTSLNVGETNVKIEVTSADGSNKKVKAPNEVA